MLFLVKMKETAAIVFKQIKVITVPVYSNDL